ncbi:MAG: NUDIX domain-containing protein [Woeseiaceae bacterium]|nr:NUDIX domain-containing protein [Woeseiaceae bacterium]
MFSYEFARPAVTVDLVTFAVRDDALTVLLIERPEEPFKGTWTLPGGFVHDREPLEATALRVLASKADLGEVFREQLFTFGDPDRDPRDRVLSVAYLAALASDHGYDGPATWFRVDELPELGFDHRKIVDVAVERLRGKLSYTGIGLEFMPAEFTLGELQKSWEAVLDKPLDKRNFRKSIVARELVVATSRKSRGGAHPRARLYRRRV